MRPAVIPLDPCADPRQLTRARTLVRVKFLGVPPEPPRGGLQRFVSRVIGCLVAARP